MPRAEPRSSHAAERVLQRRLAAIVLGSSFRRAALRALRRSGPREAWLSAGFVRNAVFDSLFGRDQTGAEPDLDVIYLDPSDDRRERDRAYEQALGQALPGRWEVKNQSRMARRNGHAGYRDLAHALAHFPETATALAVRLGSAGLELLAPHGLDDLFAGVMRISPAADPERFALRCREKRWTARWPAVRVFD